MNSVWSVRPYSFESQLHYSEVRNVDNNNNNNNCCCCCCCWFHPYHLGTAFRWSPGCHGGNPCSITYMQYMQICYPFQPLIFYSVQSSSCRCQRPRGLRRESAAARLLGYGLESHQQHGCLSLVRVALCQVEVSASDWSLDQRIPIDCGVPECACKASNMRRPWPISGCRAR